MKRIIVSLSGGKDSTATLLRALDYQNNHNVDVIPVFFDTRWESKLTYQYLEYLEDKLKIDIIRITNGMYPNGLPDVIRRFNRFPFGRFRFCTGELKIIPFTEFLKEIDANKENTEIWIGIRLEESHQRKKRYKQYVDKQCKAGDVFKNFPKQLKDITVKMPLLDWTANKVFCYLSDCGIRPNPLYRYFNRVGCFPCLLSGKKDFERCLLFTDGLLHLKILLELEKETGQKVNTNFSVKEIIEKYELQRRITEW